MHSRQARQQMVVELQQVSKGYDGKIYSREGYLDTARGAGGLVWAQWHGKTTLLKLISADVT